MKHFLFIPIAIMALFTATSCNHQQRRLPILGEPRYVQDVRNGKAVTDTSYPVVGNFSLIDQDSNTITNQTFAGKIYVADFVFLSCPSICPKMTKEMQKAYLQYAGNDRVMFVSHSIDPEHDTVARLRKYTHDLGVSSQKWHFLTGNEDSIMTLAKNSYYSTAFPDSADPGNFIHSGGLLLVDRNRHLRGVYDGTNPKETKQLIEDIQVLLKEQF